MVHDKDFAAYYRDHSQAREAKRAAVSRRSSAPVSAYAAQGSSGPAPQYWRADLLSGIPKLDAQHKEIFRQAEILMDPARAGQIPETLDYLTQHVARHFAAEEKAQAALGYHGLSAHCNGHADFTRRFQDFKRRFETAGQGRQAETVKEIHHFLIQWFTTHIMNQDRAFAEFYKKSRPASGAAGRKKHGFLYRLFHFWRVN